MEDLAQKFKLLQVCGLFQIGLSSIGHLSLFNPTWHTQECKSTFRRPNSRLSILPFLKLKAWYLVDHLIILCYCSIIYFTLIFTWCLSKNPSYVLKGCFHLGFIFKSAPHSKNSFEVLMKRVQTKSLFVKKDCTINKKCASPNLPMAFVSSIYSSFSINKRGQNKHSVRVHFDLFEVSPLTQDDNKSIKESRVVGR